MISQAKENKNKVIVLNIHKHRLGSSSLIDYKILNLLYDYYIFNKVLYFKRMQDFRMKYHCVIHTQYVQIKIIYMICLVT